MTVVDFKVELGQFTSVEYNGNGVRGDVQDELDYMIFLSSQQYRAGARMGDYMMYFGPGEGPDGIGYFTYTDAGSGGGYYF